MKKTQDAKKVARHCGYWKHLRPFAKRLAAKAARRLGKKQSQIVP